jgi:hypothetical protein
MGRRYWFWKGEELRKMLANPSWERGNEDLLMVSCSHVLSDLEKKEQCFLEALVGRLRGYDRYLRTISDNQAYITVKIRQIIFNILMAIKYILSSI